MDVPTTHGQFAGATPQRRWWRTRRSEATPSPAFRRSGLRFLASTRFAGPRPPEAWHDQDSDTTSMPGGIDVHLLGDDEPLRPGVPIGIHYATSVEPPRATETPPGHHIIGPSAPTSSPWPHPLIDTSLHNPVGRRIDTRGPLAVLRHEQASMPAVDDLVPETLRQAAELEVLTYVDPRALDLASLRTVRALVDHPSLHPTPGVRAEILAAVTSRGCPVLTELDAPLRAALGDDLSNAIDRTRPEDLEDSCRLEAASVQQRRAALRSFGQTRAWRTMARRLGLELLGPPTMSVLLATNRPHRILQALDRFDAFVYPEKELILALHGTQANPELRRRIRSSDHLRLLEVPGDLVLGEVLNRASDHASGEVIVKMDDDDLYGPEHLDDLDLALEYSGASVVGKAAAFVYLEEIDTTIRRMPQGSETSSRTIAGGALAINREALRGVGGWRRSPRSVDQFLFEDVERSGGRLHRTHPFGFILWRSPSGHTWETSIDYFLRQAVRQWSGLALEQAGIRHQCEAP